VKKLTLDMSRVQQKLAQAYQQLLEKDREIFHLKEEVTTLHNVLYSAPSVSH